MSMCASEEDQEFIDSLDWGLMYAMTEDQFRDPIRPWNRKKEPRWHLGVDGLDLSKPRPHWKRPGLGLRSNHLYVRTSIVYISKKDTNHAKPASGIE